VAVTDAPSERTASGASPATSPATLGDREEAAMEERAALGIMSRIGGRRPSKSGEDEFQVRSW
jgi:hypothetical protein